VQMGSRTMIRSKKWTVGASCLMALVASAVCYAQTQTPATPAQTVGGNASVSASDAAVRVAQEDPAVVKRGAIAFATNCAGCHGATAKGTSIAPDLIRSTLVEDDNKGDQIGPVLRVAHPKGGTSKLSLSDQDITDLASWLRVQVYGAAFRQTYVYLDTLVGDPKKGEAYFKAKCASCHSPTGDLAGIGTRFDPPTLQSRWITGGGAVRGGRGGRGAALTSENGSTIADTAPPNVTNATITITVTLANGQKFDGVPISVTDFVVVFKDMSGAYHSYARADGFPKVEVHNPLQPHVDILKALNDSDMHDVTAYLVTLK
jgi:cytochrome c oxidase cbb3-type subunit 3